MRSKLIFLVILAAMAATGSSAASSTVGPQAYVDVWTDKGEGEIYSRGEGIDIFVETSFDAYVIIYALDTDGNIDVVFPYDCKDDGFLRGGTTYRVVSGLADGFVAGGSKGVAYVRAVASAVPFRRLYWPGCPGYERYAGDVTWSTFADYWGPALPPRIYGDPYVAMQAIDEFICWDSANTGTASVDYTYYYVMERVEHPVYYVHAPLHWPHSWYWPYWGPYWNVCWNECWDTGVYICVGLGNRYPVWSPWAWSWYSPTWCAPSWCWPSYYRPSYASWCPRPTSCASGHCGSCSRCTGKSYRTYPSQVKYKNKPNDGAGGTAAGSVGRPGDRGDLYTRGEAPATARKTLATDDGRGVTRIKEVSSEVRRTSETSQRSKTPAKVSNVEPSRSSDKRPQAAKIESDRSERDAAVKSRKPVETSETSRSVVSTRKTTSTPSKVSEPAPKPTSKTRSTGKSESSGTTRSSSARTSSVRSSSSSGSSTSHKGSPTTRRSVSR
jgi:hypothetical protein